MFRYGTKLSVLISLFLFKSSLGLAHGEQKSGPHGGSIKMPGAFHTELITDSAENIAKIYLLDIEFKNPTTEASEVEVRHVSNSKATALPCAKKADYYECQLDKSLNFANGKLLVKAKRLGTPGVEMEYKLPLTLSDGTTH